MKCQFCWNYDNHSPLCPVICHNHEVWQAGHEAYFIFCKGGTVDNTHRKNKTWGLGWAVAFLGCDAEYGKLPVQGIDIEI